MGMQEIETIKAGSKTRDGKITVIFEGYDSPEQIMERMKYTFTPDAIAAFTKHGLTRGDNHFTVHTCTCCGFGGGGACGHCACEETCYPGS